METYRCEKIWLWRQRTTDRPPVQTGRKGLSRFCKGGNGDPRIAACVCRGETFTSSPKGSSWSLSSKDIEFRFLAWSHFQDIFTQLSILGQIERKHNKFMTNTKVGPIFLLGLFYLLGRFSIDDGDGSENFQKINSRFITKITTLHVHHAFYYISLLSLHDYDVKKCVKILIVRFTEDVNKQRRIFLSLSKLECVPKENNSWKIRLHL